MEGGPQKVGTSAYDADGDGVLSELEQICMKYDTDRNGIFSILEVEKIVEDMIAAKKQARNMSRLACGLFILLILMGGAMIGGFWNWNQTK